MAIAYLTVATYLFTNLDSNNITANGIKLLMPMQLAKLQLLNLSNIYINTDWNRIGVGVKWLTKISMPHT
jgi:hypothetical protein